MREAALFVRTTTRSGQKKRATSKQRISQDLLWRLFVRKKRSFPQERVCRECSSTFLAYWYEKKKYCSKKCSAQARVKTKKGWDHLDSARKKSIQSVKKKAKDPKWNVEARKASSERMRLNNPSKNPETLAKIAAASKGRTFLSRGGNGKLTRQQTMLCQHLGLDESRMEWVIVTKPVQGLFPSLPRHYKVDLAIPEILLAIEVDGNTHKTKKWKFLDRRKTEILTALGWSVLRFWNEEVDMNVSEVVERVNLFIALKSKTPTTSTPMES